MKKRKLWTSLWAVATVASLLLSQWSFVAASADMPESRDEGPAQTQALSSDSAQQMSESDITAESSSDDEDSSSSQAETPPESDAGLSASNDGGPSSASSENTSSSESESEQIPPPSNETSSDESSAPDEESEPPDVSSAEDDAPDVSSSEESSSPDGENSSSEPSSSEESASSEDAASDSGSSSSDSSADGESASEAPAPDAGSSSEASSSESSSSQASSSDVSSSEPLPAENEIMAAVSGFDVRLHGNLSDREAVTQTLVAPGGVIGDLPTVEPGAGKMFRGWVDANGRAHQKGTVITGNIDLYPKIAEACTVTFEGASSMTVAKGERLPSVPSNPSPSQNGWFNWATSATQSGKNIDWGTVASTYLTITGDITFKPYVYYYTNFNFQGGKVGNSTSDTYNTLAGHKIDPFPAPAKTENATGDTTGTGASFVVTVNNTLTGWKTDNGTAVTAPYTPSSHENLNAQWSSSAGGSHTVTFDFNGGKVGDKSQVVVTNVATNAVIKGFPAPQKAGYAVLKWTTGADGSGQEYKRDDTKITGSVTLYAQYKANDIQVFFRAFGNRIDGAEQTVSYGNPIAEPDPSNPPFQAALHPAPITFPSIDKNGNECECTLTYQFDHWEYRTSTGNAERWDFSKSVPPSGPVYLDAVFRQTYDPELQDGAPRPDGPSSLCRVTFHPCIDGKDAGAVVKAVIKNQPVRELTGFEKDGFHFAGWSTTYNETAQSGSLNNLFDFSTAIHEDIDLYAVWSGDINVIFNTDGGHYFSVTTATVLNGEVSPPDEPRKPGYTFAGWSKTRQKGRPAQEIEKIDFPMKVLAKDVDETGSIELWAWYESGTAVEFHYQFTPEGGTEDLVITKVIPAGQRRVVPTPESHKPAGKTLLRWYDENGATVLPGITAVPFNTVMKVYAEWTDAFTVEFYRDSTTIAETGQYKKNDVIKPPNLVDKSGTTVTRVVLEEDWYMEADCTNKADFTKISQETSPGTTVKVYAKWTNAGAAQFTVKLHANAGGNAKFETVSAAFSLEDGGETAKTTLYAGNKIPAPLPIPVRMDGKELSLVMSWYEDPECTIEANLSGPVIKNMDLYAYWAYKVELIPGQGNPSSTTYVQEGGYIEFPYVEADKLYLEGWSQAQDAASGDQLWDTLQGAVDRPLTLYGVWSAIVTFDPRGGNFKGQPVHVWMNQTDKTVAAPTPPTRTGAIFLGWTKDYWGKEPFRFRGTPEADTVEQNITLYAQWSSAYTLTVRVEPEEGGVLAQDVSGIYKAGDVISVKVTPHAGYELVEWTATGENVLSNTNQLETTVSMPAADCTVTAVLKKMQYTLTVETKEGGTLSGDGTGTYTLGQSVHPVVTVDTARGYRFLGWIAEPQTAESALAGADTLTPTFTMPAYSCKLTANITRGGPYWLSVHVQNGGTVVNNPQGYHYEGEKIILKVVPDPGYEFIGWEGQGNSPNVEIGNKYSTDTYLIMPGKQCNIVAHFRKIKSNASTVTTTGGSGSGGGGGRTGGSGGNTGGSRLLTNVGGSNNGKLSSDGIPLPAGAKKVGATAQTTPNPQSAYSLNAANPMVSAARMASMINRNKTYDLVLKSANAEFTFAKGTMQTAPDAASYDFRVSFGGEQPTTRAIQNLAGHSLAVAVHYPGAQLPAQAQIKLNVGAANAGKTLHYYYYNPETKALEYTQQSVTVDASGWVTVRQAYGGDYAFLNDKLPNAATVSAVLPRQQPQNNAAGGFVSQSNGGSAPLSMQFASASAAAGTHGGLPNRASAGLILMGIVSLAASLFSFRKFLQALRSPAE